MKRKDNLTDVVEDLQKRPEPEPLSSDHQVVNNDGSLITLGKQGLIKVISETNGKVIELSIEEFKERVIKPAVEDAMEGVTEKVYQKVLKQARKGLE
jgi:hypothetical protein